MFSDHFLYLTPVLFLLVSDSFCHVLSFYSPSQPLCSYTLCKFFNLSRYFSIFNLFRITLLDEKKLVLSYILGRKTLSMIFFIFRHSKRFPLKVKSNFYSRDFFSYFILLTIYIITENTY
jgi:hypothetical protein